MLASATRRGALLVFLSGPIIDFLEELVVLPDLRIVRIELERLLVRLARFVELALVLVADREIVVRGGVGRIDLRGFFPAVDRLAPKPALSDADPEFNLRFGVFFRVGRRRRRGQQRGTRDDRDHWPDHRDLPVTIPYLPAEPSKRYAMALPKKPAGFARCRPAAVYENSFHCPIIPALEVGPRKPRRGGSGLLSTYCYRQSSARRTAHEGRHDRRARSRRGLTASDTDVASRGRRAARRRVAGTSAEFA